MRAFQKPLITVIIAIALFIGGFFFLLRGCLSKYDERSALNHVLYFEKTDKAVLFSIVKFEEATSYSQKGGFTNKTVSTKYYIQANDALTGEKIAAKKIKHQRDIKGQAVEVMGAAGNIAWVYMGELMAFDPFTLERKADRSILEEKNPFIKNKLPLERKYYLFNPTDSSVHFTATDGESFKINVNTLVINPSAESEETTGLTVLEQLKKKDRINQVKQDSLYEQKAMAPSRRLTAKEISYREYTRITKTFMAERKDLYDEHDSLDKLIQIETKREQAIADARKKVESLTGKTSIYFNQAKSNMDTLHGNWYGIYTQQELEKLYNHFQYSAMYGETGRRKLFTSSISNDKSGDLVINKETAVAGLSPFLDGGFLLNKQTGTPFHLERGNPFLVIYKNQIGNEGKVLLSRVATNGKIEWTFDTQLKDWADWIYAGNRLFIFGTNNKNLSSGEINILWSIDLATGKGIMHDYFKD